MLPVAPAGGPPACATPCRGRPPWVSNHLQRLPIQRLRNPRKIEEAMVVVLDTINGPRHPEKAHKPDSAVLAKPDWIRVKAPVSPGYFATQKIMRDNGLHTVCEEAGCPNIGECWEKKHATFMIMGDTCTRACAFCNVKTGLPGPLDAHEPGRVAEAVAKLGLKHVVVTSVDRDDLDDGGAGHFAAVIGAIRAICPATTIEVLTPDFLRKDGAVETVVAARPDVFTHNLETVPSKYLTVRPGARSFASIRLLQHAKDLAPDLFTKSGMMVGLGEERNEVLQVMDDLRAADVDFLTIGQYLQPSRKHHPVVRFVPPDEFKAYETIAYAKGFLMVSASPLTRSSHHAGDDFAKLQAARAAMTRGALRDAELFEQAPGSPQRGRDVRSRGRCRALSGIRAAVQGAENPSAHRQTRRHRNHRRRHDGIVQGGPRSLHQQGDAGSA